ncbi:hypothetical protein CGLAUT_07900 [Corynebacterium glaucum]|uniref:hypothetical protein n=1 Tax=Corynebacterium glaucum TaxID=187491 RepID=UPI0025B45672|nr:hypothetical protein [Corynebacterium glaucum]WJZ08061.1 hypothetical protein CGLAUT_07900 [Corynebacterium glaucum]
MTQIVGRASEIETSLRDAAGALALAGHSIDDPRIDELVRLAATGEITVDEMLARVSALLLRRVVQ